MWKFFYDRNGAKLSGWIADTREFREVDSVTELSQS